MSINDYVVRTAVLVHGVFTSPVVRTSVLVLGFLASPVVRTSVLVSGVFTSPVVRTLGEKKYMCVYGHLADPNF